MTEAELKALYTEAYRVIRAERGMREHVFRDNPAKQARKIAEMDRLLEIVTRLKDELKRHVETSYEQPALLDVPKRVKYN